MNRTALVVSMFLFASTAVASAQEPAAKPPAKAEVDPIDELVGVMRAAEGKLKSVAIELSTSGVLLGDATVTTKGVLHVLRGTQAAIHTKFEYSFGDGIRGRAESSQTATGIVWFEDSPASGEVFVQIDAKLVEDLEWAGGVLQRDNLPGMSDRRAAAPLGSEMLAAHQRQFVLAADGRTVRGKEAGTWLVGARRPKLDEQDPSLPIADRVELFVRAQDKALLEVRQFVADKVVLHLVIDKLEVDVPLPAKVFTVDGGSQRLRPVQQYPPMWEQIEQALKAAETKSEPSVVRPSKR